MKPGRLNIGIVGGEPSALALGQALQEAGHLVVALSNEEEVDRTEFVFPNAHQVKNEVLMGESDLVILGVSEGELTQKISELEELFKNGQIVLHTSIIFDHTILASAQKRGAITLAISPAMNFTGTSLDLVRMRESAFAVSAENFALPIAQALVIELGGEPVVVSGEQRTSFAEALAVASNFSAMIVNQSIGLLEQAGVSNPASVLAPIIRSAVDQALSVGYKEIDPKDFLGGN